MFNKNVLVIATSNKTRGGITAVVKSHSKGNHWNKYNCKWIETHIDTNIVAKVYYLFLATIKFMYYLPFSELIHIHHATNSSLLRKSIFFFFSFLFRKKVISHFHASGREVISNKINRKLLKIIFLKCNYLIVLSKQWENWIKEDLNIHNNIKVVFNPCQYVQINKHIQKNKSILFAGTLIERKGYKDLLQAFSLFSRDFPEWKLIFAGNGEIDIAREIAKQYGIESQVEFLGWISGEKKHKVFSSSMIFCLPSYSEGFPMAVLDAWSYGLPVVCTPVGGLPDVIKDQINCLSFNPGDIDTLSFQIKRIIENEELRNSIIEETILLSQTIFNINTINSQIEKMYEELINLKKS